MLGLLLRILVASLLALGAWKALGLYSLYRYGEHMRHCLAVSESCRIVASGQPDAVATSFTRDIACVRRRQPWYEALALGTPRVGADQVVTAGEAEALASHRADFAAMCREWGPTGSAGR